MPPCGYSTTPMSRAYRIQTLHPRMWVERLGTIPVWSRAQVQYKNWYSLHCMITHACRGRECKKRDPSLQYDPGFLESKKTTPAATRYHTDSFCAQPHYYEAAPGEEKALLCKAIAPQLHVSPCTIMHVHGMWCMCNYTKCEWSKNIVVFCAWLEWSHSQPEDSCLVKVIPYVYTSCKTDIQKAVQKMRNELFSEKLSGLNWENSSTSRSESIIVEVREVQ